MDKKKIAAGLAAVVGVGTAAAGALTLTPASAQPASVTSTTTVVRQFRRGHVERHPEIRRALMNLNQAKNNLQNGSHDFGGHREKALDLVNKAIDQCNQALQDDRH